MLRHQSELLNLDLVNQSLYSVESNWAEINHLLEVKKIGKKDDFTTIVRERLVSGYEYLDELLLKNVEPFSPSSFSQMLALNDRVHYGTDMGLRIEYSSAMKASSEQFYKRIDPIADWYTKHKKKGDHPYKLAAEVYVAIVGKPQLFVEGNHRTGNLIANWINMYYGLPPFVLSSDNAISYFAPSAEIKFFADKSTWRGKRNLPKYRNSFRNFWEGNVDDKFIQR